MPGECEDGYSSDTSVILPFQPVKQVRLLDVLSEMQPNQVSRHAVVTPSKIQSLLLVESDDSSSDDENTTPRPIQQTPDTCEQLIGEETPFKLYLTPSPQTTPQQAAGRGVLQQIQNVQQQVNKARKQIIGLVHELEAGQDDDEDIPLTVLKKKLTNDHVIKLDSMHNLICAWSDFVICNFFQTTVTLMMFHSMF